MVDLSVFDACDADAAGRARWLDEALAGPGLAEAIGQIAALGGQGIDVREVPPDAVRAWLGEDAAAVLGHGMASLPKAKLDELFRRPGLLVGLQELVLAEGAEHWNRLGRRDAALDAIASRQRPEIARRLGLSAEPAGRPAVEARRHPTPNAGSSRRWSGRRTLLMLAPLAAAAAVLLAVAILPTRAPQPDGPGPEPTMIVKVTVPVVTEPAVPAPAAADDSEATWPAHPWRAVHAHPAGTPTLDGLAADSQDWSRQLRDAPSLTVTQVAEAAVQAREAIAALDGFVAAGKLPLVERSRADLQTKCRAAVGELDKLRSAIEPGGVDSETIGRAKSDIVEFLEDVEAALREGEIPATERRDAPPVGE